MGKLNKRQVSKKKAKTSPVLFSMYIYVLDTGVAGEDIVQYTTIRYSHWEKNHVLPWIQKRYSICLFIYLSIYLSFYLSFYLSI